jgi:signal recognition particle GTPase
MTNGAVWVPLELFSEQDVPTKVKSEEFGESTIRKRQCNRAPAWAYLLSPLRARLWNRNVGVEAAAAICQQVTAGKEPVKAANGAARKVFATTTGLALNPSRFWLNEVRAMPKSPCCGSSS